MKQGLFILIFALISFTSLSQKYYEIGIFGGASYYRGDINPKKHFPGAHTHMALGIHGRYNLNPRWALKGSLIRGRISGVDANFQENPFQRDRNLSFHSSVYEAAGTLEFNFFKFNPFSPASFFQSPDVITPYSFIGLAVYRFNPKANLGGNTYNLSEFQTENEDYNRTGISIPYGMGVKMRLSEQILISFEYGLRLTFTDYLDDVSGFYPDGPNQFETELAADLSNRSLRKSGPDGTNWGTQRGDSQSNDWYHFAGITISVNITRNPHDCHFNQDELFY